MSFRKLKDYFSACAQADAALVDSDVIMEPPPPVVPRERAKRRDLIAMYPDDAIVEEVVPTTRRAQKFKMYSGGFTVLELVNRGISRTEIDQDVTKGEISVQ